MAPWFYRLELSVIEELEDLVTSELAVLGTLGLEVSETSPRNRRLRAYFLEAVDAAGLERMRELGARDLMSGWIENRDWLATYRERARPIRVGARFSVDPRDELCVSDSERLPAAEFVLHVPARRAFGTGSHPTTRLVVEVLEDLAYEGAVAGATVLDVGCGSGILGLAARCLGARAVHAFDVDPVAVLLAAANARQNRAELSLFAATAEAIVTRAAYDLELVNVLPESLGDVVPRLASLVGGEGRVVLSGVHESSRRRGLEPWLDQGLEVLAERSAEDWVAFLLGWETVR